MGRKKKEVVEETSDNRKSKTANRKPKALGFDREQDMMIFTYLFTSRPDLRIKC